MFAANNTAWLMIFKYLNRQTFNLVLIGLLLSGLSFGCSDESSSNNDNNEDRPTLTTDEDGNVDEINCGPGDQIFIDGVDVCAE